MAESSGQGRKSRRELEEVVSAQKEQLLKYETRLRDVVRAYKGLAKEKEALDQTLAVLQGSEDQDKNPDDELAKLTAALQTVTSEKTRLESMFQEDKKKTLNEKSALEAAMAKTAKDMAAVKAELEEMKGKWIVERHQRDKEADDHALMMRELQKVVSEERVAKESLEKQLEKKVAASAAAPTPSPIPSTKPSSHDDAKKRVKSLEQEIKSKELRMKEIQASFSEDRFRWKREMEATRLEHKRALERAEERAEKAEVRGAGIRSEHESRVINLEARLQELSEAVGTYDRLRQQDQSAIGKLKERVHQLEGEKSELQSSSRGGSSNEYGDDDSNLDVQSLIDRISRLKTLLKEANRRSENPVDLDDFLDREVGSGKWKERCLRLQDELDKKTTAERLLKSPSRAKILADQDEEMVRLQETADTLKGALAGAKQEAESLRSKVAGHKRKEAELHAALEALKADSKEALTAHDSDTKAKIVQLEAEVAKQRQRCLTIIDEKEDEVAMLKSTMEATIEAAFRAAASTGIRSKSPDSKQLAAATAALVSSQSGQRRSRSDSVAEDLTASSSHQAEGMVLYYEEELKLKDVELAHLKAKHRELDSTLRELQMKHVSKEEKYLDEIDGLKDRMFTLQRMSTKEGANIEYLKNVVLTYMLSSDMASREHMLKAIGAVLTFTPEDLAKVRDYNASWWWGGTAAAAASKGSKMFQGGGAPKT